MKYLLVLLCLLATARAEAQNAPRAAAATDEAAVRAPIEACLRSWNRHDYTDVASYTTADVDWVTDIGMWWRGREAVQRALQTYHRGMYRHTTLRSEQLTVRLLAPGVALAHQRAYISTYYPPDGIDQEYNRDGDKQLLISYTLLRQQGQWLIAAAQVTGINQVMAAYNPVQEH
ncbi:SgcJ/EcaC family oxidoreductase [Hymenobacter sp. 15J16-1T3B]|uniref:SgcJ/EcaC family oxidoreductase n=1 Tax=Hymenobacter sp. 15J16-1T3B TaxID=2886941 RepID=UPI001D0FD2DB|nr:SgcJ/EcaC family oxidoreductase [Hymenobacter sp. 15J16-1T3B]MCC3156648.1 SgcJ/EcaC family oxidoreductase [Hymenobacter sp. 15J16-1T3B]